ncbi:BA75_00609T0 [Komagataella pastoris]|uniref:BA75_00609T0 n=1 Tax=Komagataella pastoris TaxID=4922 RepID=A0A1B2J5L0_PICPA|nr:BA75_00609T0 [Komagataella pastoris]
MGKRGTRRDRASNIDFSEEQAVTNELDDFAEAREKILLEESGMGARFNANDISDEDEEVAVLGLDEDESSDEEEALARKFRGASAMDDDEDAELYNDLEKTDKNDEQEWGESRDDYYGGAEVEDEEAVKLMEQEAIKQQKKHLEDLNMEDFLDDDMDQEWKKSTEKETVSTETAMEPIKADELSSDEQVKFLKKAYPEFLPLLKEYQKMKPLLLEFKDQDSQISKVKFTALSAYLGTIAVYVALFVSALESKEQFTMKDHPVMEGILNTREVWRQANELSNNKSVDVSESVPVEGESESESEYQSLSDHKDSEDSGLEVDLEQDSKKQQTPSSNKTLQEANSDSDSDAPREYNIKSLNHKRKNVGDDLTQQEKRARKRSLRFYTSVIDQADGKKTVKYAGDDDIPYKERLFERQQRLIEEARKRGDNTNTSAPGEALDDGDFESADEEAAQDVNNLDDSYYQNVLNTKKEQKAARKALYEEAVQAAKEGKLDQFEEKIGTDGKRAVNYQILKNKGLTAHRKKENRNARVKKRNKYEKAQKKLKSIRAVYTGEQGPYEGEKTGIKKNLTKSVKLV